MNKPKNQILIVDDEPDIREVLELTLGRMNLETRSASNIEEARHLLTDFEFDLCLTDMRLPDGDGLELVEWMQAHAPGVPVAVITAHGNIETAVQALKLGAFDFISKPLDLHHLRNIIENALHAMSGLSGGGAAPTYVTASAGGSIGSVSDTARL